MKAHMADTTEHKLSQQYIDDVYVVWLEGGIETLRMLCKEDPAAFVNTVARLVPIEVEISAESFLAVRRAIAGRNELRAR
jgi:hypothetical protein